MTSEQNPSDHAIIEPRPNASEKTGFRVARLTPVEFTIRDRAVEALVDATNLVTPLGDGEFTHDGIDALLARYEKHVAGVLGHACTVSLGSSYITYRLLQHIAKRGIDLSRLRHYALITRGSKEKSFDVTAVSVPPVSNGRRLDALEYHYAADTRTNVTGPAEGWQTGRLYGIIPIILTR